MAHPEIRYFPVLMVIFRLISGQGLVVQYAGWELKAG